MNQQTYYYGLGRRKSSIAKVRLYPGNGVVIINGRPMEEVFSRAIHRTQVQQPLRATENDSRFNVQALVKGGGVSGWAGAIAHGVARALVVAEESYRQPLRKLGFLTRDARVKERKKPGLKRARKAPQYTKR